MAHSAKIFGGRIVSISDCEDGLALSACYSIGIRLERLILSTWFLGFAVASSQYLKSYLALPQN
jgi:hypothetical protein